MGSVMEQEASLYQRLLQNISSEEENVIVVGDFFSESFKQWES